MQPYIKTNNKIKQQIQELYNLINSHTSEYGENIFKIIKKQFEDKDKLFEELDEYFYDIFEDNLSIILTKIKQIYTSYDNDKKLDIKNLLYNKDNLTLEDRISRWIDESETELDLLYHMTLILDTELNNLIRKTIANKVEEKYTEIFGCDCCGGCSGYYGIFPEDELEMEPPYHPGCHCIAISYEEYIPEGEI